jgi:hypothetical protein
VFRTYEPTRDRLVAVKVFRLDVTPEQARALADELSHASEAGLFHPSIVEPLAAGVEGTVAYRAEEYVAAESLDVAMRHYAPAALDKALPFITQLAGAIDFARAAGVGHGALHPRDVFVTPDEARATGFGVVEALERVGQRAPVRRPYSAPERIAGERWSTPADVFSLAAIAYELLTAKRPSGTGEQIGAVDAPNVGRYGPALHAVLSRAMDDDPAKRFPTALTFAAALEAATRGEQAAAMRDVAVIAAEPEPAEPPESPEPEDVFVERDADEADYELALHERASEDEETESIEDEQDPRLFDEEADADVAFAAAHPERFAEDFPAGDEDLPARRDSRDLLALDDEIRDAEPASVEYSEADDPRVFAAVEEEIRDDPRATAALGYVPAREPAMFGGGPVEEPSRPDMLPRAIMLVVGLLVGFLAGYAVGGGDRTVPAEPPPAAAQQPAAAPPAGQQPSGKPYSEQQVVQQPRGPGAAPPAIPTETPARSAPAGGGPAATRGRIEVRSTPAGASVTVNGRWRGRTPLTLDNLPFGPYTVRVVRTGFLVAREDFSLSARQPVRTMSAQLRPSAAPPEPRQSSTPPASAAQAAGVGAIYVDSRPRGARVFIDDRAIGVTPVRLGDVAAGSHRVRLELQDHRTWTSTTPVVAGREARVTASLDPIR